jgi:hypothetical protein
VVVLDSPRIQNASRNASADKGTLFLRPDNTVDRILASGNVRVESQEPSSAKVQSNQLELLMLERQDTLRNATFSGDVRMENSGAQPMQGSAGRVVLNFTGKNVLSTVQAKDNVKVLQRQQPAKAPDSGRSLKHRTSKLPPPPSISCWQAAVLFGELTLRAGPDRTPPNRTRHGTNPDYGWQVSGPLRRPRAIGRCAWRARRSHRVTIPWPA